MKIFFDKKFILVFFILFISFVTLVYSEMVYDFNQNSDKTGLENKTSNTEEQKQIISNEDQAPESLPGKEKRDLKLAQSVNNSKNLKPRKILDLRNIDLSSEKLPQSPVNKPKLKETKKASEDEDLKVKRFEDARKKFELAQGDPNDNDPSEEVSESPEKEIEPKAEKPKTKNVITEDIVNLQSEMELKDLIQTISEITLETFVLDDAVKGKKITIITPRGGFKKKNALRLFEILLDINGFSIVKSNGVNKIVQKKDIKSQNLPTQIGKRIRESSDRYVTRLITLKNVRVNDVSSVIKSLVSKDGDLVAYPDSNTLIIIDSIDNINRIVQIINNLDVEKQIEFIKIKNAVAADVATKLLEIFSSGSKSTRKTPARTTTSRQQRGSASTRATAAQSVQASVSGEATSLGFKVITDERTNSLIVIAYPPAMSKIKSIINILDVETEQDEEGIYVIRIKNADAEQIVGVLSGLLGGGGTTSTGRNQRQRSRTTGSGSTVTGASGSSNLGGLGSRGSITRSISSSGGISSLVASVEGLRITADPATNSVVLVGSRRDYETVRDVIEELDIRRKQVFVEAAILEVGLDNIKSLGGNFSLGFTINDDNLGFGGQQLPGVPSLLGVGADDSSIVNLVGSLSGLFLGVIGEEVDPDGSGPIPPIPSFSAIYQALTSVTDVNVLSTPSIITTDNEPAEIVVADVIPFPTGSTVGTSGVTVQTIERLPVGIRLNITPQIGDGEYLNLNITTEVSATRDAPTGLNTSEFGIATTTRSADSSVVVKNGQTLVIGGLVQDSESVLQNKTPLLGDIPLIGNLFKFKQTTNRKLNLMILLTPRIVESEFDMRQLLEEQQNRKMLLQENGLNKIENN